MWLKAEDLEKPGSWWLKPESWVPVKWQGEQGCRRGLSFWYQGYPESLSACVVVVQGR